MTGCRRSWQLAGLLLAALSLSRALAQEDPRTMQSAAEAARVIPAGPWQGTWLLRRDHPALTTRGVQTALTLTVLHDRGARSATLHWQAERALCEPPMAEPCEWAGASGEARGVVIGDGGLLALLPVAADGTAHALHLAPAQALPGGLVSRGLVLHPDAAGYAVTAERLNQNP